MKTAAEQPRYVGPPLSRIRPALSGVMSRTVPIVAAGAIVLYALDAWVVRPDESGGLPKRLFLLGTLILVTLGIARYGWRASSTVMSVGMLVFGICALTIVAPIVGSYIVKQGLHGASYTGLLAIVGSLVLIAGATRQLMSGRKRWAKLLSIPMVLIILQFFVWPLGNAVYATNAARPKLGSRTPASVGLTYKDVTITAHDGTHLSAWYVPSANGAAVVLRHGSGSTRINTIDHAVFLARAGYGVLLMDARGHGQSGGRINELGWHGPQDIRAGVDYLEQRADVTRGIGVLGLSMGGEEAINAAAFDHRIAAVVAEGVGTSTYADSIAGGEQPIARFINWTQFKLTEFLSDASQPAGVQRSIARVAPRPILLITGKEVVEKAAGPIYARAGGASTTLWQLPDTPHAKGLTVHPTSYKARVLMLFGNGLLAGSTKS
jgi:uncharacterized protein